MMRCRVTRILNNACATLVLVVIINAGPAHQRAHGSTTSDANSRFQSISRRGVKCYRDRDYASARKLFEQAVEVAESETLSAEQRANAYLCLSACQLQSGDCKNAESTQKKAERIIHENKVDNPALKMRMLRRKTDINERCENWSGAIASQIELCKLYEESLGKLMLGNFSERGRLQHLELRAKNYQRSVQLGQELHGLLAKFRISPQADITIRTNLTYGTALILAGRPTDGCNVLQKVYEAAKSDSPDLAADAAAWQVFCANAEKNEKKKIYWLQRLDAVVEASRQTQKYWLESVERQWREGRG